MNDKVGGGDGVIIYFIVTESENCMSSYYFKFKILTP